MDSSEVDRISLEDGAVLERLTVPAMAGPSFSGIGSVLGTAATGRPVVLLGDLRSYTIAADGSLQRFAEGAVVGPVDQGQFAETTCTTAGECAVVLQGEAASLALPELDGLQSTAFSPAGTHAAALQLGASDATGGSIRIFDLTVGEVFRQDFVQPPAYFLGASMGGWSPDGRFFAFAVAGVLRLFDARTDEVSVLADHLASELGVVGVE